MVFAGRRYYTPALGQFARPAAVDGGATLGSGDSESEDGHAFAATSGMT
jgi:hypothetical protein